MYPQAGARKASTCKVSTSRSAKSTVGNTQKESVYSDSLVELQLPTLFGEPKALPEAPGPLLEYRCGLALCTASCRHRIDP